MRIILTRNGWDLDVNKDGVSDLDGGARFKVGDIRDWPDDIAQEWVGNGWARFDLGAEGGFDTTNSDTIFITQEDSSQLAVSVFDWQDGVDIRGNHFKVTDDPASTVGITEVKVGNGTTKSLYLIGPAVTPEGGLWGGRFNIGTQIDVTNTDGVFSYQIGTRQFSASGGQTITSYLDFSFDQLPQTASSVDTVDLGYLFARKSDDDVLKSFFDAQVGTYWQSDFPPTHPSMLMMGQNYPTSDHPKLMAKNSANPSLNIQLNPVLGEGGTETFTVVQHTDFMRPTNDPTKISVRVDDTTAANGLGVSSGFARSTNTPTGGGAFRLTGGGNSVTVNGTITGDTETAPNHRGVYQGIWGDIG